MVPAGLHVTQFSLLRTLARRGSTRITALAAMLLLDRTALSRNLDPLAARGLVAITPGRDARTREVSITAAGEAGVARRAAALETRAGGGGASASARRSSTR